MSEYKVVGDVPVPTAKGRGRPLKYPFDRMKVGDSFEFELVHYPRVAASARHYGKKNNVRFYVSNVNGRCWRTE